MRKSLVLAVVTATALAGTFAFAGDGAGATKPPGHAIDAALGQHVTSRVQNEIMVFGTWHLADFREWMEPRHLESTLALMERFAPTRIAIEKLPPDEIALLAERAEHEPTAAQVIDMFARHVLTDGQTMQEALGIDRIAAALHADGLLDKAARGLGGAERVELVAHLLAAYEYDTAVLQWSYLSPEVRAQADALPADIREALEKRLQSADEIVTLAMPLAHSLGLQRLYPVDSHYEAVRTLAFPSDVQEEVFSDSAETWKKSEPWQRIQAARARVRETGDLMALNRYVNSYEGQLDDTAAWVRWLEMTHSSGLPRFRYSMWELRDQRMTANILNSAASIEPERLLFIVGFSHKAFIDRGLATRVGVRLVQPEDFER